MSTALSMAAQPARVPVIAAPPTHVVFSWTLAGNAIYAASQFGILSVLAKLGNRSTVGQYALALAITAPVFMFTNLQLRGVQATDARDEYEFADYFTLRCLGTLVGVAAIGVIVAVTHYDRTTQAVIVLITLAKAIETFSDVIAGYLQKHERLDQVARALMLRGVLSVCAFAMVFWLGHSLVAAVAALAITWGAVVTLYDARIARRLGRPRLFHVSRERLRALFAVSLPLGVVMALISLNTNLPRYLLERKLGVAELGTFASIAYLMAAMSLVVLALGQSVCARMSRLLADGEVTRFRRLTHKLIGFAVALGLGGVGGTAAFGREILTLVYRPEYATHSRLLLLMVIAASVGAAASFLGFGMTAARCFRSQVPIMVAAVVTAAVLTETLLPSCGLMGAGYALLASASVQAITSYMVLNAALKRLVAA